jgi:hypothetical protein
MKYLSVLTPPLLVCAAFLFAVGAFLRHEMRAGRGRAKEDPAEYDSADAAFAAGDADTRGEPSGTAERPDDD